MKWFLSLVIGCVFAISSTIPVFAYTNGAMSVHEITKEKAPTALLDIQKDPTGGFNVYLKTSNFVWRPEMASMQHVPGEGHAHVYLDGRKIMRIYNQWFHLNTYQFATRAGEQLLSVEFVSNDHAPYTIAGLPVGIEQLVEVPGDEIQPENRGVEPLYIGSIALLLILIVVLLFRRRRTE